MVQGKHNGDIIYCVNHTLHIDVKNILKTHLQGLYTKLHTIINKFARSTKLKHELERLQKITKMQPYLFFYFFFILTLLLVPFLLLLPQWTRDGPHFMQLLKECMVSISFFSSLFFFFGFSYFFTLYSLLFTFYSLQFYD